MRSSLAILRRAEYLRKKKNKKELVRTAFYRDPFKFVKGLFNQENQGQMECPTGFIKVHLIS